MDNGECPTVKSRVNRLPGTTYDAYNYFSINSDFKLLTLTAETSLMIINLLFNSLMHWWWYQTISFVSEKCILFILEQVMN